MYYLPANRGYQNQIALVLVEIGLQKLPKDTNEQNIYRSTLILKVRGVLGSPSGPARQLPLLSTDQAKPVLHNLAQEELFDLCLDILSLP
jgi:hypothetical protein